MKHKKLPATVTLCQLTTLLEQNRDKAFEFEAFVELPSPADPATPISERAKEINFKVKEVLKYRFKYVLRVVILYAFNTPLQCPSKKDQPLEDCSRYYNI